MLRAELPRPARHALHRGRPNGRLWLAIGISLIALSVAHETLAAGILPKAGTYVAGTGAIASQGNGLVVTQPGSTRGVIDWNSFSIGKTNSVTFDNGSGATLNRVTGGSPSAILGRLSATGSLYVINPQGIVVGPSGVISTGGRFVASTLDICNDAFMRGSGALTLSGNSDASVINLGKISSTGGDIFLISRRVVINAGTSHSAERHGRTGRRPTGAVAGLGHQQTGARADRQQGYGRQRREHHSRADQPAGRRWQRVCACRRWHTHPGDGHGETRRPCAGSSPTKVGSSSRA